jgi:hypothetical protein
VSELCQALDERVNDFLNRPLTGDWPYLWLDATDLKVRQGGRVISVAVVIATGVNPEGKREILGLGIGPLEAKAFWVEFLRSLVARGLSGVQLVVSDAPVGLKAAIGKATERNLAALPGALHPRRPSLRAQGLRRQGDGLAAADVHPAGLGQRPRVLAQRGRSAAGQVSQRRRHRWAKPRTTCWPA